MKKAFARLTRNKTLNICWFAFVYGGAVYIVFSNTENYLARSLVIWTFVATSILFAIKLATVKETENRKGESEKS